MLGCLLLFIVSRTTALGDQSPLGCNANRLSVDIAHDISLITSGQRVNHRVTVANPGPGSGTPCDVSDVDLVFRCPAPDGTATGATTTLTSEGTYPANGSGNVCYSFDGSGGCLANAGLSCIVTVNPGIVQANAEVRAGDSALNDRTLGALHDVTGDSAFSYNKQLGVAVVECFAAADCNDDQFCTDDACVSNVCQHTTHVCPADANHCDTESCDSVAGRCVSTLTVNCDDQNLCTDDSCVPSTGACSNVFDATNDPSCSPPGGVPANGRMTGGGSVHATQSSNGAKVTHGFELHCDPEVGPNNLEVNWSGHHFHLENLTSATCSDDPAIEPPPPTAGFDTYVGEGTGTCNGLPGAMIRFTLTDAGKPGSDDTATISITGCSDGDLSISGRLRKGNHQAHRD